MAAQSADPVQQLSALFLVHQRNQLKAYLKRQVLQAHQRGQVGALRLLGLFLFAARKLGNSRNRRVRGHLPAAPEQSSRNHQKHQLRHSGNQAHAA